MFRVRKNTGIHHLQNKALRRAVFSVTPHQNSQMQSYLSIMTVIAEYLTETSRVPVHSGKLAELTEQYLRQNYARKITLEKLSQRFCCCQATLTTAFRRQYGRTIFDFLKEIRLSRAASMLTSSNKSIKEIAASCGIVDQNCFSRLFTKQYGCSPSVYRSTG